MKENIDKLREMLTLLKERLEKMGNTGNLSSFLKKEI